MICFISMMYFLVTLLESYLLGKCIDKLFFHSRAVLFASPVGFFVLLGLFELAVVPVVAFQLDAAWLSLVLVVLFLAIPVLALALGIDLLPRREELGVLAIGIAVCAVYSWAMSRQTLGAQSFDTVHYLSTTLHNSSAEVLGNFFGYRGTVSEDISLLYDYQGIYHYYAQFLKFTRQVFGLSTEATPIYIWTASLSYFYFLAVTLLNSVRLCLKQHGILTRVCALGFSLMLFASYYNITFAFFGNTLKMVAVMNLVLQFYCYGVKKQQNLPVIALMFCGLIACSSSGLFQSILFYVGMVMAVGLHPLKKKGQYFWLGLISVPLFVYGWLLIREEALIVVPQSVLLVLPLVYLGFLMLMFLLRFLSETMLRRLFTVMMVLAFAGLFAVSLLSFRDVEGGFLYFFRSFSAADMTLDYFSFSTPAEAIRNLLILATLAAGLILARRRSRMRLWSLTILILFLNPLVAPGVSRLLTSEVYGRCFEVLVNPAVLLWCWAAISDAWEDSFLHLAIPLFQGAAGILGVGICCYGLLTPYNAVFVPGEDFNAVARVDQDQYDLYREVDETVSALAEAPSVLSQDYALKGYVDHLYLTIPITDFMRAPAYQDEKGTAPYELLNVFYPRSFVGQKVWDNEPDYTQACRLIEASDVDYLVLSKESLIQWEDGTTEPLWMYIRTCARELYSNDSYVFMERVNWEEEKNQ